MFLKEKSFYRFFLKHGCEPCGPARGDLVNSGEWGGRSGVLPVEPGTPSEGQHVPTAPSATCFKPSSDNTKPSEHIQCDIQTQPIP